MNTSWDIWEYLIEKAGLDVKNYDQHIVEEICKGLGISSSCKDIKKELQKQKISSELFIGAFLKVIQPYAQMMVDLCTFFYLHGVKKTNKGIKILFDFDKGPKDLGFNLNHFREILWKYSMLSQSLTIYGWNIDTLWELANIFRDFWKYNPKDVNAEDWMFNYRENDKISLPFHIFPTTNIEEIDIWIKRVGQVWIDIVIECRKYGSNRDDLRQHYENTQQRERLERSEEEKEETYKVMRQSLELPGFKEWDAQTLFFLDNDRWPETMIRSLIVFAEKLLEIPQAQRITEAQSTIQKLRALFSNLPHWDDKRDVLIRDVLELLNLPIWHKRYELYQTWVLTQIDKALEDYPWTIHHVNDTLILKFSGTHIGTLKTNSNRIHLWSELRSPLENPLGKGRKGNIQPDYSLTLEPITDPSRTIVAIECKQYNKANIKNFSEALIDYARGCPNAIIILVNYTSISKRIFNRIDDDLKSRTIPIGDFIPNRLEEFEFFKTKLIESINGLPQVVVNSSIKFANTQFDLIAVDISGSMKSILTYDTILKILDLMVTSSPSSRLIAIDTELRNEWMNASTSLSELLRLESDRGTNLTQALIGYDLTRAVILTDNDGWNQLLNGKKQAYLVIEILNEHESILHFTN